MKKQSLFLFGLILIGCVSNAQNSFTINGQFEKIKTGTIYLNIYESDKSVTDSVMVKKGSFKFRGSVAAPSFATLTMPSKPGDYFQFYVEPSTMTISGSGDSLGLLTVQGSAINDDDKIFKEKMKNVTAWEEADSKIYEKASQEKNKQVMDSLDQVDFDILNEKRKVVTDFVNDHPQSMRSAVAIAENYAYYAEATDVEPLYNLLDEKIRNSPKGIEIKKMIATYSSVAVGKMAPEITQTTTNGNTMSLSALRGKYVLVDFWASWCGPCRRENPNVVAAYNRFREKGFTIFGVSYDTKKDRWKKAIEDDKLNWNQVSDLQGWKNSTSDQYGIKAIPANLLLDKDGKIIAKNIFGKKLVDKLSELMP